MGMQPDDFRGPPVAVWPENVPAVRLFLAMDTQWHSGMSGRTGMVYASLPEVWQRLRVPREDRDALFDDLMLMERAALIAMHED